MELSDYKGIGRKPLPKLIPFQNLKYAQVCKKREKGKIVEVVQHIIFEYPYEVLRLLITDFGSKINTSYVERFNLTIRNSVTRFIRKGINYSQTLRRHTQPQHSCGV